jgi:hypothetical protein
MKLVRVEVNDKMQKGYVYLRTKPMGAPSAPDYPELMPKQMLELGVFGKYMTDCREEFLRAGSSGLASPDQARASR